MQANDTTERQPVWRWGRSRSTALVGVSWQHDPTWPDRRIHFYVGPWVLTWRRPPRPCPHPGQTRYSAHSAQAAVRRRREAGDSAQWVGWRCRDHWHVTVHEDFP